jgi:hypothetical protein
MDFTINECVVLQSTTLIGVCDGAPRARSPDCMPCRSWQVPAHQQRRLRMQPRVCVVCDQVATKDGGMMVRVAQAMTKLLLEACAQGTKIPRELMLGQPNARPSFKSNTYYSSISPRPPRSRQSPYTAPHRLARDCRQSALERQARPPIWRSTDPAGMWTWGSTCFTRYRNVLSY